MVFFGGSTVVLISTRISVTSVRGLPSPPFILSVQHGIITKKLHFCQWHVNLPFPTLSVSFHHWRSFLPVSFPSSPCSTCVYIFICKSHKANIRKRHVSVVWWDKLLGCAEHFQHLRRLIMVVTLLSLCWIIYLTFSSSNPNLLCGETVTI